MQRCDFLLPNMNYQLSTLTTLMLVNTTTKRDSTSHLGSVGFENNQLTYISRDLDATGWPNDEGFAVARVMYDALNSSIPLTVATGRSALMRE